MNALVTGATGLLGSHLIFHLISNKYKVTALYRSELKKRHVKTIFKYYTQQSDALLNKINWVKLDLLHYDDLEQVVIGQDVIFHLAAKVSFSPTDTKEIVWYNKQITDNLVNALLVANPHAHLIHCSSIAALGRSENHSQLIDETTQWVDSPSNTAYAISKFQSELAVWRGAEEGLKASVVNPGIIIGPGFWEEGSGKLFSLLYRGFKFYSTGYNGFVDVNDVAKAMKMLANRQLVGKKYILVENNYSYKQIFDWICEAMAVEKPSIEIKPWMAEIFWRLEALRGLVMKKEPFITKELAKSATNKSLYNGLKITAETDFTYTSLQNNIARYAKFYQSDRI
ncbi:NAD-dependent epimerase/dehydratase family protein [Schleiferia thermophila]|uniref:NAD-dependent epimerase/dehydratase family protein n=1 Tax=Schleiferia thermophila TaxID=884107 RepID=UPI003EF04874